jgi:hypothetical protein
MATTTTSEQSPSLLSSSSLSSLSTPTVSNLRKQRLHNHLASHQPPALHTIDSNANSVTTVHSL